MTIRPAARRLAAPPNHPNPPPTPGEPVRRHPRRSRWRCSSATTVRGTPSAGWPATAGLPSRPPCASHATGCSATATPMSLGPMLSSTSPAAPSTTYPPVAVTATGSTSSSTQPTTPATWINGIAIPDVIRDLLLCDGTITPTFTAAGLPINVGRNLRIVPDRLRRLVEHRDKKCRVPWCHRERGLDIHHLIHWRHGGPTDAWNLIALCEHCHRAHHQGLLGITGNADRPDGLHLHRPTRPTHRLRRPSPAAETVPHPRLVAPTTTPTADASTSQHFCSTPTDAPTPSNRHCHHRDGTTSSGDSDSDDGSRR